MMIEFGRVVYCGSVTELGIVLGGAGNGVGAEITGHDPFADALWSRGRVMRLPLAGAYHKIATILTIY